jgi:hypothetical protein
MTEDTIYSDDNVRLTADRVVIHGTTYPIRNITSVKMARTEARGGCASLLASFGAVLLSIFVVGFVVGGERREVADFLISGGILAGGLLWLAALKPTYHVLIASASDETYALTSGDEQYIREVVEGINDAIARYRV